MLKTEDKGKVKWFVDKFRYDRLKELTTIEKDLKSTSNTIKDGDL
jgi:hypothetical protein